jgi:hypothetical protein
MGDPPTMTGFMDYTSGRCRDSELHRVMIDERQPALTFGNMRVLLRRFTKLTTPYQFIHLMKYASTFLKESLFSFLHFTKI